MPLSPITRRSGAAWTSSPASAPGRLGRMPGAGVWAPGLYLLLSLIFFGRPVLGHPASTIIARDDIDSSLFLWFFAWWPHALLHGINPFVTHAMFAPEGFNLQWTTPMPGPSVLLAPVTLALRTGGHLQRDSAARAASERVDGFPALPPSDRPDVAVGGRRVRVRFLALCPRPSHRRPVPRARAARAGIRAARTSPASTGRSPRGGSSP